MDAAARRTNKINAIDAVWTLGTSDPTTASPLDIAEFKPTPVGALVDDEQNTKSP
jgi:hypothetical protein